jgi:TP901 family phage tail tape measure protein
MGALPPVFVEFLGRSTGFMATAKGVKTELATVEREGGGKLARFGAVGKAALAGIGVAAGVAAVKTVHMAADFQQQMLLVQTSGGEAADKMKYVSNAVLNMAGEVGQSTESLAAGLKTIEAAGYHAKNGIDVLRVAAMGAKVGGADLATVGDALTTAMNAYHMNASQATDAMNALIATDASGKTSLEALSGAMSQILPVSAAAHVGLNEVLGAMATMTSQGTDARVAATYLRQTIGQLSNASPKAAATMRGLGLDANKVALELGKKGLAATMTTLTDAIKSKMGPAGTVLINTLQKASKHSKDFAGVLQHASGSQKTYIGALATMVGGTKSMMGALQLTGPHMSTFRKNVDGIAEHVRKGGKNVEGWADVQKTFNQRMAEAKGSVEALGIKIGNVLLPYATKLLGYFAHAVTWMTKHKTAAIALGAAIGGILAVGIAVATQALWGFISAAFVGEAALGPWVLGVMAIIAALTLLVTHWRQVWGFIKSSIPGAAGFFKSTWNGALRAWHVIWDWASKAIHAIVKWFNNNVLKWLKERVHDLVVWWKSHSKEIHQAWALLWKNVKLIADAVWGFIKVGIGELMTVFRVGMDIIVGVVKTAWAWISGVFTTGMHFVMNLVGVVLDIITGHWGKAMHDAWHLVQQAFHDIVHTIGSTVSNFGTMLWNAGRDLIHGMINGVKSMIGAVGNALSDVAHGAVNTFKSVLGIASPSKVFRQLGIWVNQGLVDGLTGSAHKVKSAVNKTASELIQARNRLADMLGTKAAKGHTGWIKSHEAAITHLESYVKREGTQLERLAGKREAIAKRLKSAQAHLKSLAKEWSAAQKDVANNIMQGASIITQSQTDGLSLDAATVVDNMRQQVQAATQFAANLDALRRRGLRSDLVKQIADAGVDSGGDTAQALLTASPDQIRQLNQLQTQLGTAANATGATVADGMYGAGMNAAKGLIKGLQSQEKAIDKQMLKIARSMERAIKHALGIHSPSRLFHEIGQFVSAGLVNGIDSGHGNVERSAHRMSDAVVRGAKVPRLSGTAGGGGNTVVVNIHVEGSVLAERDLRDTVQREMLRLGSRNSNTWAPYRR